MKYKKLIFVLPVIFVVGCMCMFVSIIFIFKRTELISAEDLKEAVNNYVEISCGFKEEDIVIENMKPVKSSVIAVAFADPIEYFYRNIKFNAKSVRVNYIFKFKNEELTVDSIEDNDGTAFSCTSYL